jgi:GNAT superfamily N-acetyltransferase
MTIRKAVIDDIAVLASMFDKYRMFYGKTSEIKAAKTFLSERIMNNDSEIFISVDENGKYAGFVQLYPLFSSTRLKRLWLLNDLFVEPDFRGKGISKALIEESKKLCLSTGACSLTLETQKTNGIGNSLYLKMGFVLDVENNFYAWNC